MMGYSSRVQYTLFVENESTAHPCFSHVFLWYLRVYDEVEVSCDFIAQICRISTIRLTVSAVND